MPGGAAGGLHNPNLISIFVWHGGMLYGSTRNVLVAIANTDGHPW